MRTPTPLLFVRGHALPDWQKQRCTNTLGAPATECSGDVHAVWAAITSHPNRRAAVNYRLQTDAELAGAPPRQRAAQHGIVHRTGAARQAQDVVWQTRTVLEGTAGTHGWWQKVARAYAVDVTGGGWSASAAASHRPHSAGVSALMAACKNGNADAVRLLLAFGPCPSRPLLVPSPLPPVARPANTCPAAKSPFSLRSRARGWLRPVAGADPAGSAAVIGSEAAGAPAGRSVRVNPPWWPADLYGAETGDETVWPAANRRGPRTLRTANERLDDPRDRCTRSYVLIGDGLGRCAICCIVTSAYGALAACVGWTTPFPSPWTRPSQTK